MVDKILEERESNYGSFKTQSLLAQSLKEAVKSHPNWDSLPSYVKESFEMILHKMARVVNGKVSYEDSYVDIIGYTQLILDELKKEENKDA
jgi:hypothetical protein